MPVDFTHILFIRIGLWDYRRGLEFFDTLWRNFCLSEGLGSLFIPWQKVVEKCLDGHGPDVVPASLFSELYVLASHILVFESTGKRAETENFAGYWGACSSALSFGGRSGVNGGCSSTISDVGRLICHDGERKCQKVKNESNKDTTRRRYIPRSREQWRPNKSHGIMSGPLTRIVGKKSTI